MPVYLPGLTFGGLGYGGSPYGFSPYGSGALPRLSVPATGGYGGSPYGLSSYGSVDITPPTVSGAQALDGFRVEVFFSEEMADNAAFTDPTNYAFTSSYGAPLSSVSVVPGTAGSLGGYTSAIVTHSGSTLGGVYTAAVSNVEDIAGNVMPLGTAGFTAFGDPTTVAVSLASPDDGRSLQLDFQDSRSLPQELLTEGEFSPGVDALATYEVTGTYPIAPVINTALQDPGDLSHVDLDLSFMTSTTYDFVAGPALAYLYDGSVLPDDDPDLAGAQIGTGTSVASASGLFLSKALADSYGWIFGDTSGRVIPGSTYRADFTVDVTGAAIAPPVANTALVVLSVNDGSIQVSLSLGAVGGAKVIDIVSGAFTAQVPADWGTGSVTVTLIRNQKAGFYTVLFDGVPLRTFSIASATGSPTHPAGTQVLLTPLHSVTLFDLVGVDLTASSTLFTSSWNFIHNLISPFTGSPLLTRDRIITRYGPLVRGWGDATPATTSDVEVRLNGGAVPLAAVNPYVGEIYPETPIPMGAPGTFSVDVDYVWFPNPAFAMSGLNTRGLTLNTHHRTQGHTPGAVSPTPASSVGTAATGRFPMSIVLGPMTRPSPKQIGQRYLGLQKGYSALLNSYTTLRLNNNPSAISVGGISASSIAESGSFDGQTSPDLAGTPWALSGLDAGSVVGDGTYRVVDASSGPYGIGQATIYERDLDLSLPTSISESARVMVESYVADGVFTGVGFGIHDGGHLLVVGLLLVDGVQHVGVLLDGEQTHLEEGWSIGPAADGTASSQSTVLIDLDQLPPGVEAGSRFRIPGGSQEGVYTVSACGLEATDDGTQVEITFEPALPGDITSPGNNEFTLLFETIWDTDLVSLRVQSGFPADTSTQVYLGGSVSGLVASLDELPPYPAQTALLLPATKKGVAFWGSLSRRAESASVWDFTQYDSNPERLTQTVQGITAAAEMDVLPQDAPSDPWYIVGGFGYAEVDGTGGNTLLKSTSGSASIDQEYRYERVEPFLNSKVTTDLEALFQLESGVLGAGDSQIRVVDGTREVLFSTLLYVEGDYTDPDTGNAVTGRGLVTDLPQASLSGLQDPVDAGWSSSVGNTLLDPYVRGQELEFVKTAAQTGQWASPTLPDPASVSYQGLISEARFSVESYTAGTIGGIGLTFGALVKAAAVSRVVGVTLDAGAVNLVDSSLGVVATFAFAWGDGELHTYRLLVDPNADIVVLVVDDTVLGNAAFSAFIPTVMADPFAFVGGVGDGAVQFTLRSTSLAPLRPIAKAGSVLGRTFGILLRNAGTGIDAYRIPRSDGTTAANSSLAAVPVPMDWRTWSHVRLLLDPNWGVSFYRPDLPLPPWATGDFATETTDPTAAWATVEYSQLPVMQQDRGCVAFGAADPQSISQSRWDFLRYRIRGDINGFGIAPQGMVLNRGFTFSSGEYNVDVTPEVVTVNSRTATLIYVPDSAIYADRVFVVQADGAVLAPDSWGFDKTSQNIILDTPLATAQHPVTITFAPGKPITKQYLGNQPIESSVTLLNDGTPAMPRSLDEPTTVSVVGGVVTFTDGPDSLYASVDYCEVEDGDDVHLSTLCDGPGPGMGFAELELSGQFFSETFTLMGGTGGPWGGQSGVVPGSATQFNTTQTFFLSGGSYTGGLLAGGAPLPYGSGAAVMYPNARGADGSLNTSGMGMNQEFLMTLTDVTPREDVFDLATLMGDNVPPTSADPATDPNPDGVPGATGNGAAAYVMEDFASSPFSRLGPWGGAALLSVRSLSGGGAQLNGTEFVLGGGAQLPVSTVVTTGVIEAAN